MPVTLVRHTTPDVAPNTCYGQTDLDVTASFGEEGAKTIAELRQVDRIISSPLQRCTKLAALIGEHFNLPVALDERIAELSFGRWEGQNWSAIPRAELDLWAADVLHARPHGGETVAELRVRTHAALTDYTAMTGHTVLVTHSGVIRAALSAGDTIDDFSTNVTYGGIIKYKPQPGRRN